MNEAKIESNEWAIGQNVTSVRIGEAAHARRVIPEKMIYFENIPRAMSNSEVVVGGYSVNYLHEENDKNVVDTFVEHTWYSATVSTGELHTEVCGKLKAAVGRLAGLLHSDLLEGVRKV